MAFPPRSIGIAFVHFRTTSLAMLDAAWFSLSKQNFKDVARVVVLDNNTDDDVLDIEAVLNRYPIPVPYLLLSEKHGDKRRTQSWSVNQIVQRTTTEWIFHTRTDFLLNYDCLAQFQVQRHLHSLHWRGMVTSYCHQMGCDAELSNRDVLADYSLPEARWRTHPDGPASLVGQVPANYFHSTDKDAGVWLLRREDYLRAGGMDERLVAWGYQTQRWQRALLQSGVELVNLPQYLYHHQHHAAVRDFSLAGREASQV